MNAKNIYNTINSDLQKIKKELMQNSETQKVQIAKDAVLSMIKKIEEDELIPAMNEFEKNSEWEKLVIAFYGETNQGKSTIIEALRLYFGETTKQYDNFDGEIIGNGKSDFTRQIKSYEFKYKGESFTLLDVPGIEGDESEVLDEIYKATQKAHIVFYVTSKTTPPQSVEDGKTGTIEKIKKHLNSQTEVYAIYNKRVTNPIQLKCELVSKEEIESLKVLDSKLKEVLKEHYVGYKTISAKPAFLVASNKLQPESILQKEKNKFLDNFSIDEVFSKTNFISFMDFIVKDIAKNIKIKIKRSNFNKINSIVSLFIDSFKLSSSEYFEPLYNETKKQIAIAKDNLGHISTQCKKEFENSVNRVVEDVFKNAKEDIRKTIRRDITNDSFKKALKGTIEDAIKNIQQKLPTEITKTSENIKSDIEQELKEFKKRFDVLTQSVDYNIKNNNCEVGEIKSKGSWLNTILNGGTVAGGLYFVTSTIIANGWNPLGWGLAAIAVLCGVWNLGKSIRAFFDSEYKMSQQENQADKILKKESEKIINSINNSLKEPISQMQNEIEKIKSELDGLVNNIYKMKDHINDTVYKLEKISNNIKREIA